MNIGILKEQKTDENRVALTPTQVAVLTANRHRVYIEKQAGKQSNYTDADYQQAGGMVVSKAEVLKQGELLLKVKCPLLSEYQDYQQQHTLFSYLHFDENISVDHIQALTQSGFLGIAYEWVEEQGRYPLLEPMSQITGYLFYQRAKELCTQYKGILCPQFDDLGNAGANLLIIGIGTIGTQVLRSALTDKLNLFIVDKHPERVKDKITAMGFTVPENLEFIRFEQDNPTATKKALKAVMPKLDMLINCAVRRPNLPKSILDYLVDAEMVQSMAANSVVCDATACDKDLIETCVSSEHLTEIKVVDQVIHYNPDHIPSLTGQSSTEKLTEATFPYIELMANQGIHQAIKTNAALAKGVSCYQGKLTHAYTTQKKQLPHHPILDLLA